VGVDVIETVGERVGVKDKVMESVGVMETVGERVREREEVADLVDVAV